MKQDNIQSFQALVGGRDGPGLSAAVGGLVLVSAEQGKCSSLGSSWVWCIGYYKGDPCGTNIHRKRDRPGPGGW